MRTRLKRAEIAAKSLRVCAHPHRLIILCLLDHKPWSVGEISRETGLNQPLVSQHLARLREAGIVTTKRRGTSIFYHLNNRVCPELVAVVDALCRAGMG